jgi:hypothetical protein
MKLNQQIKTLLPLAAFAGLAVSANAAVTSIDFDWTGGVISGEPTHYVGMTLPGQVGAWHNLNVGNGNTPDSPTITTPGGTLTVNTNATPANYRRYNTGSNVLREDFFYLTDGWGPVEWELTGLTPGGTYDIILYGRYDPSYGGYRGADMSVNGSPIAQEAGFTDGDGYHAEGDWNAPGVVADGTGKITGVFAFGSEAHAEWGGIQFQEVPEPTTTALLGLGGLALILRRRK